MKVEQVMGPHIITHRAHIVADQRRLLLMRPSFLQRESFPSLPLSHQYQSTDSNHRDE